MPHGAIEKRYLEIVRDATGRYNASRGAFVSFMNMQLSPRGVNFVNKLNGSLGGLKKVPAGDLRDIREMRDQTRKFKESHGYEPPTSQLADLMKTPESRIRKLQQISAPEYSTGDFIDRDQEFDIIDPAIEQSLRGIKYS